MSFLRTIIEKAGTVIGVRRRLNFIEGSNVTLTIVDDSANDEIDITIASTGGGGVSDGDKGDITVSSSGTVWTVDNGLAATKIANGTVTDAEFQYLGGVTSDIQTQIGNKQDTLVSATNIKTINGSSVLGAGDLVVSGALPDLVITKYAPALDQTITAGYSAYYSGYYEIADTKFLEIGQGSTLEIG